MTPNQLSQQVSAALRRFCCVTLGKLLPSLVSHRGRQGLWGSRDREGMCSASTVGQRGKLRRPGSRGPTGEEGKGAPSPSVLLSGRAGAETGFWQPRGAPNVGAHSSFSEASAHAAAEERSWLWVRLMDTESHGGPEQGIPLSQPQFPHLGSLHCGMMARCRWVQVTLLGTEDGGNLLSPRHYYCKGV